MAYLLLVEFQENRESRWNWWNWWNRWNRCNRWNRWLIAADKGSGISSLWPTSRYLILWPLSEAWTLCLHQICTYTCDCTQIPQYPNTQIGTSLNSRFELLQLGNFCWLNTSALPKVTTYLPTTYYLSTIYSLFPLPSWPSLPTRTTDHLPPSFTLNIFVFVSNLPTCTVRFNPHNDTYSSYHLTFRDMQNLKPQNFYFSNSMAKPKNK